MEWLFRVAQEPRRLFWRYLKTNLVFAAMVIRAMSRRDQVKTPPDNPKRASDS
jgi:N-acetylglucosaminyldiphosphoundecaprenol N-acetyl-beta-D-mannosaminyltransferase